MKKTTLSIGIPAYNEGKNIKALLEMLLLQREDGFKLNEIIIISDGSSDDTVEEAKSVVDKRIIIVNSKKRMGKSARMNQIYTKFNADILVLMDADVLVKDRRLLAKAVAEADIKNSGIAGINATPFASEYFFEQVLETGVDITKLIASRWNNGKNYLSFKGCFLMLDGKLAKSISMPASLVNNDAYLYFAAKAQGYTSTYIKDCEIYYRSPNTMKDHLKQSSRFKTSQDELAQYFDLNWEEEYKMPLASVVTSILQSLLKRPVHTVAYILVNVFTSIKKQTNITSTWSIATSTK